MGAGEALGVNEGRETSEGTNAYKLNAVEVEKRELLLLAPLRGWRRL